MTSPTLSDELGEAVRLLAPSAAAVSALSLMLSSAQASADAFRAAVRHSDLAATMELAVLAASIVRILNEAPKPVPIVSQRRNETFRSYSLYDLQPDGRPVVT